MISRRRSTLPTTAAPTQHGAGTPAQRQTLFQTTILDDTGVRRYGIGDADDATLAARALQHAPALGQVGRYQLKRLLGEGGIGKVHAAWDPLLARPVAVKAVILDTAKLRRRGERVALNPHDLALNEARAIARLSHPNIVTLYDVIEAEGRLDIVMELLHGSDLQEQFRRRWRPTMAEAVDVIMQLAHALDYAHGRGVIHCDIKPSNIHITADGRPRLLDFGIARLERPDDDRAATLTAGSPHYLAPEQHAGGEVDGRCDVYSLGVVFYELLTAKRAFAGKTFDDIKRKVMEGQTPNAHRTLPSIRPDLAAIVERAMSRSPQDRQASAGAFLDELREWLAGQQLRESAIGARASRAGPWTLVLGLAMCAAGAVALIQASSWRQAPVTATAAPPDESTVERQTGSAAATPTIALEGARSAETPGQMAPASVRPSGTVPEVEASAAEAAPEAATAGPGPSPFERFRGGDTTATSEPLPASKRTDPQALPPPNRPQ